MMQIPNPPQYTKTTLPDNDLNPFTLEATSGEQLKELPKCSPIQKARKEETDLLLSFKAGFSNGNLVLLDWKNTTDPCASWFGIVCSSDGTVTEM